MNKDSITRYLLRRNGNEYFCGKQFAGHADYAWCDKATNAKMWTQQLKTVKNFVKDLKKKRPDIEVEILTFTISEFNVIPL